MQVLVTGGAGFIGSLICKRLVKDGHQVVAVDNLSNGCKENLQELESNPHLSFYEFDVNNTIKLRSVFDRHPFDMLFHLAANADVNKGEENAQIDLENTFQTTLRVLEMMRFYVIKKIFLHPLQRFMEMLKISCRNIALSCALFLTMAQSSWQARLFEFIQQFA